MRKQLLLLFAVLATVQVSTAQDRVVPQQKNNAVQQVQRNYHQVQPAAILWSSDFSNPADWVISNQAGNSDNWVIGTTGPSGSFAIPAIASTSAANGFALFDSDLLCSGNQIADLTMANSVDCSAEPAVMVKFEQFYRRYDDSCIVFVSVDNTNWTAFPVNYTLANNDFVGNPATGTNPTITTVDISSVAANQATVWVRFEFYSPSTFVGPAGAPGCAYAWMIDDVSIETPPPSTAFWSDDFSNPANWTISNQAGNSDNWVIGTTPPSGSFAIPVIASTTAANGFALFDSDLLCSGNQIADLTTANSISTIGHSVVQLQFQQYYRRFDDSCIVFVSIDGTTWTAFPVNYTLANNDFVSANPEIVNIDITSVAANQATVWLRWEFYSPSTFVGPAGAPGCAYAWMIDDVNLSETCSAPAITAISQVVCPGSTVDLTIPVNPNQTYQWESSTDSINWAPIGGATSTTYTATITGTTWFRVVADCGGGLNSTSSAIQIEANPTAPLCYCIPFSFPCNGIDVITNVSITGTTLNSTTSCDTFDVVSFSNYQFIDPATATATLNAGTPYDLNVTTGEDDIISVWIDYDQNGSFDVAEWTQVAITSVPGVANTVSITVPTTALNGQTGMRIRSRLATFVNDASSACVNMGSGETEDYFITITGGVGIAENEFANTLLSPSLTSDLVSVDLGTANINNAKLMVFDVLGNVVISNQTISRQKFDVSLGAFEAGVYIVRVYNGSATFNGKVTLVK